MDNIPWAKATLSAKAPELVLEALSSTWISGGPFVDRLERELPARLGAGHGVAVSNGTTALHLALLALGIGPGDEVIVPGYTFVAPANMVLAVGAIPVYADVDPDTWCLDPASVEAAITDRTRAIMPVHLYGNVADMAALRAIAHRHSLVIVEDTAEAAFSRLEGKCAGTFGNAGTLSFHATKTLATGEGGMVLTDDPGLAERMRTIRDHGMRRGRRYWHDVVGYNFRMPNLQGAIGCANLAEMDHTLAAREHIYNTYRCHLAGIPGLRLQGITPGCTPALWALAVQLIDDRAPELVMARRDAVLAAMGEAGIECRPGFYAFSMLPPYDAPSQPNATRAAASVLVLPTFVGLTDGEIGRICETLAQCLTRM